MCETNPTLLGSPGIESAAKVISWVQNRFSPSLVRIPSEDAEDLALWITSFVASAHGPEAVPETTFLAFCESSAIEVVLLTVLARAE